MKRILIVDDEPGIRTVLRDILSDEGHQVLVAEDGFECLRILKEHTMNLVLLDVWLPNMGGMDVLKKIRDEYPELAVILISGHANIDLAVKALKLGAFDFLEKPLSLEKVVTLIHNALKLEDLRAENEQLKSSLFIGDEMIGSSSSLEIVRERIRQSAASMAKVLITGENGTGKELVAREIHRNSDRRGKPFIEVNCAAIPDSLIESELFGHEKGSFTGAVSRRKGKFEAAHGGTLFLDEVADMSLTVQAKVLRAIQELKFERVGSETSITVDVRLLAASNKDIQEEIRQNRFREDLFFRLNVIPITVPPLRERKEDIPLLLAYFFDKFRQPGVNTPRRIVSQGMDKLCRYEWPGNIRELKNFVERLSIMSDEEEISLETVEFFLGKSEAASADTPASPYDSMRLNEAKEAFERKLLTKRLEKFGYNISRTAQDLGIYPSNLHGKIKKYRIDTKK